MAKAKKSTEETPTASDEKKAAPKKKAAATAAKKIAKPAGGAGGFGGFGIDTNLAAQNAAKMLLNRSSSANPSSSGGTVKHLKDSLAKSQSGNLGNLLGNTGSSGGKASNLPHFTNQQKSQNQATGHVGNTGVPRRTPG